MHGANPNISLFSLLGLFLAGIALGSSYMYTKNLWYPIAFHFSWNLFQSLLGFNVSGQDIYSIIEFTVPENNKINGGQFGFEGSIFSILTEFILSAINRVLLSNKNKNLWQMKIYKIIGLMSGTSLDGLDLAYCHIWEKNGVWEFDIKETKSVTYSSEMLNGSLKDAISLSAEKLIELHNTYGTWLGGANLDIYKREHSWK